MSELLQILTMIALTVLVAILGHLSHLSGAFKHFIWALTAIAITAMILGTILLLNRWRNNPK